MRKLKLLYIFFVKFLKKVVRGDLKYHNKNIFQIIVIVIGLFTTVGVKDTINRIKKEILIINQLRGNNLIFPNGIVTGVDKNIINSWYKNNHRKVTIIIPSYNDLEVLIPCVESLKKTININNTNIIIVDDYCRPENTNKLKEIENDFIRVIFRKTNGGFAKAVNTGIEAVEKDRDIILLNSDIVAQDNWLESLQYGAYEFGVDTGMVGPKLLYPDGKIQSAGTYRNQDSPQWFDHYYRFQDSNYPPANIPHYCLAMTGACLYVKREFINYIGILDEKFQFAFEDVDWCIRGWEKGYRTLYFPSAVLTHVESATRHKNKKISEKEKSSIKYFWKKWGKWFDKRNVFDEKGRVRIIFVLQSMGLSGGIKSVFEQANMLADKNFNIEIWGLDARNIPWYVSDKVKVRTFKNYERLTVALSNEEAIKVATWWETSYPVWIATIVRGIPVYFIQEFETWFYPDNPTAQATVISCYRKEFNNLTQSSYNQNELSSIGLKSVLIPLGYDEDTYKPLGLNRKTNSVLAVGRSFFQKNFKFTLKGWQYLNEKRPNMILFGNEPRMAKLDSKIKYIYKPTNDEVNKLYNQATVFIQTSRHEGYCLPIIEAMATGCPVICTDAHGNRDFCFNNKNCLMVEQDDVVGLSKAIDKVINNNKLREKLSKEAIYTSKKLKWSVIIERIANYYNQLAETYK